MGRVGSWALCCKTFQQLSCLHGHVIHGKEWVTKNKLGCLCKRLLQEALEFLFIKNNYKDYIMWNFVSKTTRIPQEGKSTWHVWSALLYISLQNKNQKSSCDGYWDDVFIDVAIYTLWGALTTHARARLKGLVWYPVTSSANAVKSPRPIDNFNLGIMLAILQTYEDWSIE